MSDVTLHVGGRNYTVACQDGQEGHIQRLAEVIDAKLSSMGANLSTQEAKNLLFAALLLADELEESQKAPAPSEPADFDTTRLATQLERIAAALENAATTLES
ncbi:cell division protein ZapA [Qipengyuania sp. XHP0207]|uniref:cell division protein ZapA n=1 Tax=Qipengyuania sp. XHP0207 TaxID=3038078 RepID=UPI00241C7B21|nr:cell division protein ZapA [Qipengyuania sp. XHP0207]MDG5748522.1 cell division protein ZapA [Qipengyuania sp. XHP0207]